SAARHLEELKRLQTPATLGRGFKAYQASAEPHIVEALDAIVARDAERFEGALTHVLARHRQVFDSDENLERNAPNGFMSIAALMLAQFAGEHGIPVRIENRYLPVALLDAAYRETPQIGLPQAALKFSYRISPMHHLAGSIAFAAV